MKNIQIALATQFHPRYRSLAAPQNQTQKIENPTEERVVRTKHTRRRKLSSQGQSKTHRQEDNRPALEKKVEGKEKKERKKERTLRRTSTVDFMMNIEKEIDEREKNVSLRAKSMFEQMEEIDPERIIRIKKVPYLLLGKLGEGGHGSVYKVRTLRGRLVAYSFNSSCAGALTGDEPRVGNVRGKDYCSAKDRQADCQKPVHGNRPP